MKIPEPIGFESAMEKRFAWIAIIGMTGSGCKSIILCAKLLKKQGLAPDSSCEPLSLFIEWEYDKME